MNIWQHIGEILIGFILGIFVYSRIKKPDIVTDTYIDDQLQRVGKIKTRGRGNEQTVKGTQAVTSVKEVRQQKRQENKTKRKLKRNNKKQ